MDTIDKWYSREIERWRTGAAVAWSILYVPVGCILYITLANFTWNPLNWLSGLFGTVFSLYFMLTMMLMIAANGLYYAYSSKTFAVIPKHYPTRMAQVKRLFEASCFVHMVVCALAGMILARLAVGLLGPQYAQLAYKCAEDSDVYCINERHLFLVLYGGFTGKAYVIYHYLRQHNLLQFPSVQQAKYFQVRTRTSSVAWSSLGFIIWQIKFYYIWYYLFGNIPRDWIMSALSLKHGSSSTLDSVYWLVVDVSLLWQSLVLGLFIQFSWSFGALLYKVYHTQHYEFPIGSMFDNFKNKCLVDAMGCTNHRLVQALGFYDLNLLSKHSYSRRQELFSLSQPGGHAHKWNNMIAVCLSVIHELSDAVRETNWKILASAPVRHPSTEIQQGNNNKTVDDMAYVGAEKPKQNGKSKISFKVLLQEKFKSFIQRKPGTSPPVESPESRSKNLFVSAFIQIWAVEAVSALVAASFQEDKFGVVQMSLKDILIAMLSLHEDVDKHFKLTGGVTRKVQKSFTTEDLPLKYLLENTLKSSIYRIVNTFGKHLLDVGLPPETEKKLHHFLDYKE